MTAEVTTEREGGVATLTFQHVTRHNALSHGMVRTANRVLAELHDDADLRLLVLRGAGDRAFISGADIGEQNDEERRGTFLEETRAMIDAIGRLPVPVLAVINGYCLGAGIAVAAQADVRLASDSAQFGVPATRLGLAYPYAEVSRLTSLVGPGAAADLLLSGRRASAEEALRWGLVQSVSSMSELEREATEMQAKIAANAPLSLRAAKLAVRVAAEGEHSSEQREVVDRLVAECTASADYAEGRAAFTEKRPPRFSGR